MQQPVLFENTPVLDGLVENKTQTNSPGISTNAPHIALSESKKRPCSFILDSVFGRSWKVAPDVLPQDAGFWKPGASTTRMELEVWADVEMHLREREIQCCGVPVII
ncbi:hypothetical protein E2C01_054349 [Portunus trituberculatus]|uniref:Uncharacterized protein n=1 Tax=Portunus trituberculatus TaxID=210409 RepID=A0A5B7GTG3_PORTR|nr:hypothetical protein [Portunus trituberculatus]